MFSFYKYHGLGNDFIFIDNRNQDMQLSIDTIVQMCHRNFGIGADGIVLVENSQTADVKMTIFNSDGSNPNMCGNAVRCFGKFVYDKNIVRKPVLLVDTAAGLMKLDMKIENNTVKAVKVNMGKPIFDFDKIPCTIEKTPVSAYELKVDNHTYEITSLLLGVPHTVVFSDDISDTYVIENGKIIENAACFPQKTNVNFVKVISRKEIELRTWERGAGYTLACGTGACASAAAGIVNNILDNEVLVHLRGGDLIIQWNTKGDVYMEGSAEEVFEGVYKKS